jgi:hypothetical protein
MKKRFSALAIGCLAITGTIIQTSCNKQNIAGAAGSSATTAQSIAVAARAGIAGTDSLYILHDCGSGSTRDSINFTDLPLVVTDYIENNYTGYLFNKAFDITDNAGNISGYVVIIYYNDKPVGIEFDSNGQFIKVLEQSEFRKGPGRGKKGPHFPHRDGLEGDTIAITSIPAAISDYMGANYSGDTLLKAYINEDSSYIILSKNAGLFATAFNSSGVFISRLDITGRKGFHEGIVQSDLPQNVLDYLNTTYPGYLFKKGFLIQDSAGAISGYLVFLDDNNTKYAVAFDGAGNFVSARTVR